MSTQSKIKAVFNIVEGKDDRKYWNRIGTAFVNKDGSLNVLLSTVPLDGKLHIREQKAQQAEQ